MVDGFSDAGFTLNGDEFCLQSTGAVTEVIEFSVTTLVEISCGIV